MKRFDVSLLLRSPEVPVLAEAAPYHTRNSPFVSAKRLGLVFSLRCSRLRLGVDTVCVNAHAQDSRGYLCSGTSQASVLMAEWETWKRQKANVGFVIGRVFGSERESRQIDMY